MNRISPAANTVIPTVFGVAVVAGYFVSG